MCPYPVHDFKEFHVDEDLNQTREEIVKLANIVGFMILIQDDVMDLLMSKRNFPLKV